MAKPVLSRARSELPSVKVEIIYVEEQLLETRICRSSTITNALKKFVGD